MARGRAQVRGGLGRRAVRGDHRPVRGRRVRRRRAVRRPDGGVRRRRVPGARGGLRQVRGLGVRRRELLGLRAGGRRPGYGGGRGLRGNSHVW